MVRTDLLAFLEMPGSTEWLVILLVGLLFFGGRLPEIARSVGKSIAEFKKGIKDAQDEFRP
ncbi:MAG: twin-arginine translocase TatA/TatE family subunit [Phycisphaerales bacterium]|nr:twin-arginine translocase TatA/TatE family subunit [Phycisphaerales bacterium]